jgi:YYY domain-containing protein
MNFAYFNAVLRSTVFPPLDPWFAGGYMNYYYYGYVLVGAPVRLLRVTPALAYNIIVPMLYALTGIGAFSLAFNLVERLRGRAPRDGLNRWVNRHASPWLGGVAALVLAVMLGNLDTIRVFIGGLAQTGGWTPARDQFLPPLSAVMNGVSDVFGGGTLMVAPHRWYWAPTRVLEAYQGSAINEFPYFTYLFADLHAHMIAMPLTLLALLWALGEIQGAEEKRGRPLALLSLFIGALTIGILRATNSWDWITYTIVGLATLTFTSYLRFRRLTKRALFTWGAMVLVFMAVWLAAALPFTQWFGTTYTAVQFYQNDTTPLWAYIDMHGIFLFLVTSLLVWETVVWLRTTRVAALRGRLWGLLAVAAGAVALLAVVLFLAFIGLPTERVDPETGGQVRNLYRALLVAAPLTVWAALLFFRPRQGREKQFVMAAIVLALAITIGVEFVVLVGDIGRQNTIFKFYLQVWLILSAVAGAAVAWLFRAVERWWAAPRVIWTVALAVLVLLGALYPITATRGKLIGRMAPEAPSTLDGMAYMQYAVHGENGVYFSLKEDYEAIRWLQENVEGTPVILEAQLPEYHWGSRISIYTGMPTVLGWNWHQRQQRTTVPQQLVWDRAADVSMMYNATDVGQAWGLLSRYEVSYIIVGALERATYDPAGLAKFAQMVQSGLLEQVYEKGETVIYRVVR